MGVKTQDVIKFTVWGL